MLLTIIGYPLALRCASSGESSTRLISILAFSLMFRGITLEPSRFMQIFDIHMPPSMHVHL